MATGVSALFTPMTVRGLTARNRIWVAPMCQYSVTARDGVPTDWHLVHLGSFATGGFGLVLAEATAVVPEGRISPQDTGLWNDAQTDAWHRITDFAHGQGTPIGVQLAHAGRKASTYPWLPDEPAGTVPGSGGGWQTVAPSAVAFPGYDDPRALTTEEVQALPAAFAAAALRADAAGFDLVQLHAAHGYLLHQFCSPLSNQRTDEYGGDFENRTRLVVEVVDAVRAALPAEKVVAIRFSGTDWIDGGWTIKDTVRLTAIVKEHGVDLVDVSSGGLLPTRNIPVGPGYQVDLASAVRAGTGVVTSAVGLITEPPQAEAIVAEGHADAVSLARAALREPRWPHRAAAELGVPAEDVGWPAAYWRAHAG